MGSDRDVHPGVPKASKRRPIDRFSVHGLPLLAAAGFLLLALAPTAEAQPASAVPVRVSVYVLSIGSYDVAKGTYTIDFYLTLSWNATEAGADFTPAKLEFMNGRARVREEITAREDAATGVRTLEYRVAADLYSQPRFDLYPYGTQTVEVVFEDTRNDRTKLVYVPDGDESGLDPEAQLSGWNVEDVSFGETTKDYGDDEAFSRARFAVTVSRAGLSTTLKTFLPPAVFVLVSLLSFFFHPSKAAARVSLGTGMLFSAVAFHLSQTVALPPLGTLIFFDKVMISVYAFLATNIGVAILLAVDEDYWKDRDHTRAINAWGAAASLAVPALVFLVLSLV